MTAERRIRPVLLASLLGLLSLLAVVPARAQYTEDEDLEEHRQKDEEYLQRYTKPADLPADPAAARDAFLAAADRLIRDKNHRSLESGRYRIQTDDPRLDLGAVGELLESFATFFDGFWPGGPAPPGEPTRVFLFYSYHKYNQLLGADFSRQIVRPAGHYGTAFDALVIHSDPQGPAALGDTLVHEAAHQRVARGLAPGGARTSTWVAEGLASYFEHTHMDDERAFEAGAVGPKRIALVRGQPAPAKTDAKTRLSRVRDGLSGKKGEAATPLALDVVTADEPAEFYGPGALERYDRSWVLVHYLLHADAGRYREGFLRYLALDASGQGDPAALERECGLDLGGLDPPLSAHIKTIPVR